MDIAIDLQGIFFMTLRCVRASVLHLQHSSGLACTPVSTPVLSQCSTDAWDTRVSNCGCGPDGTCLVPRRHRVRPSGVQRVGFHEGLSDRSVKVKSPFYIVPGLRMLEVISPLTTGWAAVVVIFSAVGYFSCPPSLTAIGCGRVFFFTGVKREAVHSFHLIDLSRLVFNYGLNFTPRKHFLGVFLLHKDNYTCCF